MHRAQFGVGMGRLSSFHRVVGAQQRLSVEYARPYCSAERGGTGSGEDGTSSSTIGEHNDGEEWFVAGAGGSPRTGTGGSPEKKEDLPSKRDVAALFGHPKTPKTAVKPAVAETYTRPPRQLQAAHQRRVGSTVGVSLSHDDDYDLGLTASISGRSPPLMAQGNAIAVGRRSRGDGTFDFEEELLRPSARTLSYRRTDAPQGEYVSFDEADENGDDDDDSEMYAAAVHHRQSRTAEVFEQQAPVYEPPQVLPSSISSSPALSCLADPAYRFCQSLLAGKGGEYLVEALPPSTDGRPEKLSLAVAGDPPGPLTIEALSQRQGLDSLPITPPTIDREGVSPTVDLVVVLYEPLSVVSTPRKGCESYTVEKLLSATFGLRPGDPFMQALLTEGAVEVQLPWSDQENSADKKDILCFGLQIAGQLFPRLRTRAQPGSSEEKSTFLSAEEKCKFWAVRLAQRIEASVSEVAMVRVGGVQEDFFFPRQNLQQPEDGSESANGGDSDGDLSFFLGKILPCLPVSGAPISLESLMTVVEAKALLRLRTPQQQHSTAENPSQTKRVKALLREMAQNEKFSEWAVVDRRTAEIGRTVRNMDERSKRTQYLHHVLLPLLTRMVATPSSIEASTGGVLKEKEESPSVSLGALDRLLCFSSSTPAIGQGIDDETSRASPCEQLGVPSLLFLCTLFPSWVELVPTDTSSSSSGADLCVRLNYRQARESPAFLFHRSITPIIAEQADPDTGHFTLTSVTRAYEKKLLNSPVGVDNKTEGGGPKLTPAAFRGYLAAYSDVFDHAPGYNSDTWVLLLSPTSVVGADALESGRGATLDHRSSSPLPQGERQQQRVLSSLSFRCPTDNPTSGVGALDGRQQPRALAEGAASPRVTGKPLSIDPYYMPERKYYNTKVGRRKLGGVGNKVTLSAFPSWTAEEIEALKPIHAARKIFSILSDTEAAATESDPTGLAQFITEGVPVSRLAEAVNWTQAHKRLGAFLKFLKKYPQHFEFILVEGTHNEVKVRRAVGATLHSLTDRIGPRECNDDLVRLEKLKAVEQESSKDQRRHQDSLLTRGDCDIALRMVTHLFPTLPSSNGSDGDNEMHTAAEVEPQWTPLQTLCAAEQLRESRVLRITETLPSEFELEEQSVTSNSSSSSRPALHFTLDDDELPSSAETVKMVRCHPLFAETVFEVLKEVESSPRITDELRQTVFSELLAPRSVLLPLADWHEKGLPILLLQRWCQWSPRFEKRLGDLAEFLDDFATSGDNEASTLKEGGDEYGFIIENGAILKPKLTRDDGEADNVKDTSSTGSHSLAESLGDKLPPGLPSPPPVPKSPFPPPAAASLSTSPLRTGSAMANERPRPLTMRSRLETAAATIEAIFDIIMPALMATADRRGSAVPLEVLGRSINWSPYRGLLGSFSQFMEAYDGVFFSFCPAGSRSVVKENLHPVTSRLLYCRLVAPFVPGYTAVDFLSVVGGPTPDGETTTSSTSEKGNDDTLGQGYPQVLTIDAATPFLALQKALQWHRYFVRRYGDFTEFLKASGFVRPVRTPLDGSIGVVRLEPVAMREASGSQEEGGVLFVEGDSSPGGVSAKRAREGRTVECYLLDANGFCDEAIDYFCERQRTEYSTVKGNDKEEQAGAILPHRWLELLPSVPTCANEIARVLDVPLPALLQEMLQSLQQPTGSTTDRTAGSGSGSRTEICSSAPFCEVVGVAPGPCAPTEVLVWRRPQTRLDAK